jgi:hypothetical protein
MTKLTKKQLNAQEEEAYARDMREIQAMDLASAESAIIVELEVENKDERTRGGMFEDAYGGPIVVSN